MSKYASFYCGWATNRQDFCVSEPKVTQIFMMSVLFNPMVESGMAPDTAWRVAMIVPAVMFLIVATSLKLLCWDTPTAKRFDVSITGKTQKPSLLDYVEVCKDIRVIVMIAQYSACFGADSWQQFGLFTSEIAPRMVSTAVFI